MARYSQRGLGRIAKTAARMGVRRFGSQRKVGRKYKGRSIFTTSYTTAKRVRRLERMIETKEGCLQSADNIGIQHNNILTIQNSAGGNMNPLASITGTADVMGDSVAQRIGDQVTVRGVLFKAFFENALDRAKVHYRVWLVRCAKGDNIDRGTFFRNNCGNKMIDQINTERYSIVASKKFTISTSNAAPTATVTAAGIPGGSTPAGIGTRAVSMWIPGHKFGRNGVLKYENNSAQPKFYDYRFLVMAYDWYGTPQDTNNVGKINDCYYKFYFKDA